MTLSPTTTPAPLLNELPTDLSRGDRMNVVIVGHVDHGKSTVIGRLLADTGSLPEGKLEHVRAMCERNARPFEYAFLLDALKNEQAQGITIDTARCFFKTDKRHYIINDAPGHIEFLKNMITGAARAEAALLVIDAHEGIQENSKRHGYMISMLGIRQIVVLVNKMDLEDYREDVFEKIRVEYTAFLEQLGVHPTAFIPIAAREGDNIASRSERMLWYTGNSVLEQVDDFEKPRGNTAQAFRMPVQDIYKFTATGDERRIISGTIETGTVSVGDEVVFLPSRKRTFIKSIERFQGEKATATPPQRAEAGEATGFQMTTQIYIKPGELMCRVGEREPYVGRRFRVNMFWMGRAPLIKGRDYKLKIGSARVGMRLAEIRNVLDASELTSIQGKQQIDRHDVGECVFETVRPVAFDERNLVEPTGRFVIVDDFEIAGCGVVLEALSDGESLLRDQIEQREFAWEKGRVTPELRAQQSGHTGKFIVFTGPVDTGRRAIAWELEQRLFQRGARTYYFGIGNMFGDLDQAERTRSVHRDEHIEQLGNMARIMTDAGLLFITTLTDIDDYDLERLKQLNAPNELLVVNVGENQFSSYPVDVQIDANPDMDQAVSKVVDSLFSQKVLFDFVI